MNVPLKLNDLRIASPCHAPWSAMAGDDRTRFCQSCSKHVYNIAALSSHEVRDLIARTEGNVCVRLHRRRDGTVLTADCPVGLREWSSARLQRLTSRAVMAVACFSPGLLQARQASSPSAAASTSSNWFEWALQALGIRTKPQPPGMTMGVLRMQPPPGREILGKISARPLPQPASHHDAP